MHIPKTIFSWTVVVQVTIIIVLYGSIGWNYLYGTDSVSMPGDNEDFLSLENPPDLSELREPIIVVDKSDQILQIHDQGRVVAQFPASTGANEGDKEIEGDQRTPEGKFYVCMKNPKSRYTLSLGLSYPNIEDAGRGLADGLITRSNYRKIMTAIRNRKQPPWKTSLGGEIMIHGCRNGGRKTLGCIALEDDVIRTIYPLIETGTTVIIRR